MKTSFFFIYLFIFTSLKVGRLVFLINTVLWHVCNLLFFNKMRELNEHPPRVVIP